MPKPEPTLTENRRCFIENSLYGESKCWRPFIAEKVQKNRKHFALKVFRLFKLATQRLTQSQANAWVIYHNAKGKWKRKDNAGNGNVSICLGLLLHFLRVNKVKNTCSMLRPPSWDTRLRVGISMCLSLRSMCEQSINQSINQLYLNTVNGSASWFSDMPCKNYKV